MGQPLETKFFLVGDVAGRYSELEELLKDIPNETKVIFVGDAINKGPNSKEVLELIIANPNYQLLLGNHEFQLIEAIEDLNRQEMEAKAELSHTWLETKAAATIKSYLPDSDISNNPDNTLRSFNQELTNCGHLDYLIHRPILYYYPGLVVSHSPSPTPWLMPLIKNLGLENDSVEIGVHLAEKTFFLRTKEKICEQGTTPFHLDEFLSYRKKPKKGDGQIHVFGHVSRWGFKKFTDKEDRLIAICIDNSSKNKLIGLHWPSLKKVKVKNHKLP